jgi:hypothetical protein
MREFPHAAVLLVVLVIRFRAMLLLGISTLCAGADRGYIFTCLLGDRSMASWATGGTRVRRTWPFAGTLLVAALPPCIRTTTGLRRVRTLFLARFAATAATAATTLLLRWWPRESTLLVARRPSAGPLSRRTLWQCRPCTAGNRPFPLRRSLCFRLLPQQLRFPAALARVRRAGPVSVAHALPVSGLDFGVLR